MNLHKTIDVACSPFRCVKQGNDGGDLSVENIYFQVDSVHCFSVTSTQNRDRDKLPKLHQMTNQVYPRFVHIFGYFGQPAGTRQEPMGGFIKAKTRGGLPVGG
jgi:hypothetical protein